MKSLISPQSNGLRGLAFVLALAGSAYAGPGLAAWQSLTSAAAPATQASTVAEQIRACTGSEGIPIISMQPSWHNARGPLHAVQTGTRRTCTSCGRFATMHSSWRNARGPLAPITTPAEHACNGACVPADRA